jgi:hypothetical protein
VALAGFVVGVDVGALYSADAAQNRRCTAPPAPINIRQRLSIPRHRILRYRRPEQFDGPAHHRRGCDDNRGCGGWKVTVDVASTQNTYFARAIGHNTANILVSGTAEAAEHSTGSSCVKPWFVPNTVFATAAICDAACDPAQLLIDPATREVTPFAESKRGQKFSLKPQNPTGAIAPGQFYAIQLPDSVGASDYENNIATCANVYVRCNEYYSVETGNMVGPTIHGVDDLIGDPHDTWVGPGRYQRPDGTLTDISGSLVVAPVWDLRTGRFLSRW